MAATLRFRIYRINGHADFSCFQHSENRSDCWNTIVKQYGDRFVAFASPLQNSPPDLIGGCVKSDIRRFFALGSNRYSVGMLRHLLFKTGCDGLLDILFVQRHNILSMCNRFTASIS